MGHANVANLSEFFVKRLYAKGKLSIREAVKKLQEKGETLHAGEGEISEDYALAMGLEDVIRYLLSYHETKVGTGKRKLNPVIEPVNMSKEQEHVFSEWMDPQADISRWDCGNDGTGGEYGILDSIEFRYREGWRQRYKEIELLDYVEH
jgi:hypothetical protein